MTTRSEIIKLLNKKHPDIGKKNFQTIFDIFVDELSSALEQHRKVEIRGFGSFFIKKRSARVVRNLNNNESLKISDRYYVGFRCGKDLKKMVNR